MRDDRNETFNCNGALNLQPENISYNAYQNTVLLCALNKVATYRHCIASNHMSHLFWVVNLFGDMF